MRKITLIFILFLSYYSIQAQLGVGTVTPDSSSMLDISTTDKGLLIPRLTQTQRNAINTPAHSLLVFCVDCSPIGMYYYDTTNTTWTVVDTDTQLDESTVDGYVANNGYLTSFTEVDGSTTNEIQNIDLTNNTLSIDNANSVDLSSYLDNTDNQQISKTGTTVTLENGGSFTDSVLTETQVDEMVSDNGYLTSFTEVDGSTTNEIQNIDLTNNTLSIDNANSVDLSSYLDNTDNQQISKSGTTVTLEDGGSFTDSVLTETQVDAMVSDNGYILEETVQDLTKSGLTISLSGGGGSVTDSVLTETQVDAMVSDNGYLTSFTEVDGSTTNEIQNIDLTNNTLSIDNANSVDLSSYLDNTDNQQISKSGNTVTLEDGGSFTDSVLTETQVDAMVSDNGYLTSFTEIDGSTTNEIQNIDLTNNTLSIDNANSVDLSSYLDNTDNQQISRSGTTVTLEDGGSFTDSVLTETQVDAMVSDNGYLTSFTELDGSTTNEIQNIDLTNNTLSIDNANSVDLSSYLDNTDDQTLSFSNNSLSIENGNSIDLSSLEDNLGDHTATQNIELDGNWLSNDGGNEGMKIDNNGNIGINTESPLAPLHISGTETINGIPHVNALFGAATGGYTDGKIEVRSIRGSVTSSEGGVVLTNYDTNIDSTNVMGDMSILGVDNTDNLGGIRFRTTADGTYANMTNALEIDKDQNINIPNGNLTVGDYTLPTTDGSTNQVLSTNGNGDVSWVTDADGSTTNEIQDLSLSGNTLSISNDPNTDVDLSSYLDNTDNQDLYLTGNILNISNDPNSGIDLNEYLDNTDNQAISRDGLTVSLVNGGSFTDSVDNMGNHIATKDIQLNGNWLSSYGDGDYGVGGVYIDEFNNVGINTDSPEAGMHVNDDNNALNGVLALFSADTESHDGAIELRSMHTDVTKSRNGIHFTNYDTDIQSDPYGAPPSAFIGLLGLNGTNNRAGLKLSTADSYTNQISALEIDTLQNINIPNGTLTVGDYTLPTTDGIENQVLATDGEGNLSWEAAASMSNLSLSYSFNPSTHTNIYENYLGKFTCINGVVNIELIDQGNSHGSSNSFQITRDYGSTPVVVFQNNALQGNGYKIYYRETSPCAYELFFASLNISINATINYTANIKYSGTIDTTLSSADNTNILDCKSGLTINSLGRIGIGNLTPTEELDVKGDAKIWGTLEVGSYTLPSTDGTADQILKTNGSGALSWIDNDLFNHTATQNITLNDNWISNGGGDNGIRVSPNNGYVGINTDSPLAALHVHGSATSNGIPHLQAVFGSTQGSGLDGKIEVRSIRGSVTSSTGGVVLSNYDVQIDSTSVMGDMSILGTDNTNNLGGIRFRTTADGTYANMTNALEIDKDQNINVPNGALTIGGFTLPSTDGTANQILKTDGNGNVSWAADNAADNLGNHIATQNLRLNNKWLSNNGGNEGIRIDNNGKVGIGEDSPLTGLHVYKDANLNGANSVAALFGNEVSFTRNTKIEIRGTNSNVQNSDAGLILSNHDWGNNTTHVMGDIAVFGDNYTTNIGGVRLRTSSDGSYGSLTNALEIDPNQNVTIPNGTLTVGDYTLPTDNGSSGEVLVTNGNGTTNWENVGVPIGSIQMWATGTPPTGWLVCDGSSFSAGTYPELQTVLGTTTLPNFTGRTPLGVGQSNEPGARNHTLGQMDGAEQVTLTINQMPEHDHAIKFREGNEGGGGSDYSDLNGGSSSTASTENEGGGAAHENMPPYYALYFIIKAK